MPGGVFSPRLQSMDRHLPSPLSVTPACPCTASHSCPHDSRGQNPHGCSSDVDKIVTYALTFCGWFIPFITVSLRDKHSVIGIVSLFTGPRDSIALCTTFYIPVFCGHKTDFNNRFEFHKCPLCNRWGLINRMVSIFRVWLFSPHREDLSSDSPDSGAQ